MLALSNKLKQLAKPKAKSPASHVDFNSLKKLPPPS